MFYLEISQNFPYKYGVASRKLQTQHFSVDYIHVYFTGMNFCEYFYGIILRKLFVYYENGHS